MYLDPGFGSMVLQLILAGILGAGLVIRMFWKNIKNLFRKKESTTTMIVDDIDYGESKNE